MRRGGRGAASRSECEKWFTVCATSRTARAPDVSCPTFTLIYVSNVEPATDGPSRRPLLWAAIGSSVLAVPGGLGLAALVTLFGVPTDSEAIGFYLSALSAAVVGFGLLAGYWTAWRTGHASARGPVFWWTSAVFNAFLTFAIGAAAIATAGRNIGDVGIMATAAVPAAWTGWMTWLGATNAIAVSDMGDDKAPGRMADLPLLVAIVGSLWLVGQSLFSAVSLFGTLGGDMMWDYSMTFWIVTNVIGFALLLGYVWDWLGRLPSSEAVLFWWVSTGFHAISLAMWIWNLISSFQSMLEIGDLFFWLTSAVWMVWTAWMVWFSLTRVQRANVRARAL